MTYSNFSYHLFLSKILTVGFALFMTWACSTNPQTSHNTHTSSFDTFTQSKIAGQGNVKSLLEITAIHNHEDNEHGFQLSSNEVSSGWNTLRFNNATDSDHFVLLYKVPDEAIEAAESANEPLLKHWYNTITVPFQEEFNPYIKGNISYQDFANNLIGAISVSASWFLDPGATPMGGPGITASGHTSETTVNLSSGIYIVECYVKDENQEFHSYNGMLDLLTVTEISSDESEPKATMEVSISQKGLEIEESVRPGKHTVAIHFDEQPQFGYEHLLGHNAQLVKLDDSYNDTLLDELAAWMDWTKASGLIYRAPVGATFLGGSMEMPGGSTSYMSVILEPGDYAWIAEVPDPSSKEMLKTFTVPSKSTK